MPWPGILVRRRVLRKHLKHLVIDEPHRAVDSLVKSQILI